MDFKQGQKVRDLANLYKNMVLKEQDQENDQDVYAGQQNENIAKALAATNEDVRASAFFRAVQEHESGIKLMSKDHCALAYGMLMVHTVNTRGFTADQRAYYMQKFQECSGMRPHQGNYFQNAVELYKRAGGRDPKVDYYAYGGTTTNESTENINELFGLGLGSARKTNMEGLNPFNPNIVAAHLSRHRQTHYLTNEVSKHFLRAIAKVYRKQPNEIQLTPEQYGKILAVLMKTM